MFQSARALYILTWKCPSRHSGVQYFDIATSKSGPSMVCFVHFDLKMSFAPQRRAVFRHPSLELQKVVRTHQFFSILSWKCASRHSGVQLFISPLNSYLCTRRFSEPTFQPSGNTNHWRNTAFRDFPNILGDCIFFLLTLPSSDSTFFWLCFSALLFIFPYCRKLDF